MIPYPIDTWTVGVTKTAIGSPVRELGMTGTWPANLGSSAT